MHDRNSSETSIQRSDGLLSQISIASSSTSYRTDSRPGYRLFPSIEQTPPATPTNPRTTPLLRPTDYAQRTTPPLSSEGTSYSSTKHYAPQEDMAQQRKRPSDQHVKRGPSPLNKMRPSPPQLYGYDAWATGMRPQRMSWEQEEEVPNANSAKMRLPSMDFEKKLGPRDTLFQGLGITMDFTQEPMPAIPDKHSKQNGKVAGPVNQDNLKKRKPPNLALNMTRLDKELPPPPPPKSPRHTKVPVPNPVRTNYEHSPPKLQEHRPQTPSTQRDIRQRSPQKSSRPTDEQPKEWSPDGRNAHHRRRVSSISRPGASPIRDSPVSVFPRETFPDVETPAMPDLPHPRLPAHHPLNKSAVYHARHGGQGSKGSQQLPSPPIRSEVRNLSISSIDMFQSKVHKPEQPDASTVSAKPRANDAQPQRPNQQEIKTQYVERALPQAKRNSVEISRPSTPLTPPTSKFGLDRPSSPAQKPKPTRYRKPSGDQQQQQQHEQDAPVSPLEQPPKFDQDGRFVSRIGGPTPELKRPVQSTSLERPATSGDGMQRPRADSASLARPGTSHGRTPPQDQQRFPMPGQVAVQANGSSTLMLQTQRWHMHGSPLGPQLMQPGSSNANSQQPRPPAGQQASRPGTPNGNWSSMLPQLRRKNPQGQNTESRPSPPVQQGPFRGAPPDRPSSRNEQRQLSPDQPDSRSGTLSLPHQQSQQKSPNLGSKPIQRSPLNSPIPSLAPGSTPPLEEGRPSFQSTHGLDRELPPLKTRPSQEVVRKPLPIQRMHRSSSNAFATADLVSAGVLSEQSQTTSGSELEKILERPPKPPNPDGFHSHQNSLGMSEREESPMISPIGVDDLASPSPIGEVRPDSGVLKSARGHQKNNSSIPTVAKITGTWPATALDKAVRSDEPVEPSPAVMGSAGGKRVQEASVPAKFEEQRGRPEQTRADAEVSRPAPRTPKEASKLLTQSSDAEERSPSVSSRVKDFEQKLAPKASAPVPEADTSLAMVQVFEEVNKSVGTVPKVPAPNEHTKADTQTSDSIADKTSQDLPGTHVDANSAAGRSTKSLENASAAKEMGPSSRADPKNKDFVQSSAPLDMKASNKSTSGQSALYPTANAKAVDVKDKAGQGADERHVKSTEHPKKNENENESSGFAEPAPQKSVPSTKRNVSRSDEPMSKSGSQHSRRFPSGASLLDTLRAEAAAKSTADMEKMSSSDSTAKRPSTPDTLGPPPSINGEPIQALETLARQTEALHKRYAALRADRQKLTISITENLRGNMAGPEYSNILLDQQLSLNALTSSMDICFAKLKSLDCRKEEAIQELIAHMTSRQSKTSLTSSPSQRMPSLKSTKSIKEIAAGTAVEMSRAKLATVVSIKPSRETLRKDSKAENSMHASNSSQGTSILNPDTPTTTPPKESVEFEQPSLQDLQQDEPPVRHRIKGAKAAKVLGLAGDASEEPEKRASRHEADTVRASAMPLPLKLGGRRPEANADLDVDRKGSGDAAQEKQEVQTDEPSQRGMTKPESPKQKSIKEEVLKQETPKQDSPKQELLKQEPPKPELPKQEPFQKEDTKLEPLKPETQRHEKRETIPPPPPAKDDPVQRSQSTGDRSDLTSGSTIDAEEVSPIEPPPMPQLQNGPWAKHQPNTAPWPQHQQPPQPRPRPNGPPPPWAMRPPPHQGPQGPQGPYPGQRGPYPHPHPNYQKGPGGPGGPPGGPWNGPPRPLQQMQRPRTPNNEIPPWARHHHQMPNPRGGPMPIPMPMHHNVQVYQHHDDDILDYYGGS